MVVLLFGWLVYCVDDDLDVVWWWDLWWVDV